MELDEKIVRQIAELVKKELEKSNINPIAAHSYETKNLQKEYESIFTEKGMASKGNDIKEVVIAVAPCFGVEIKHTLNKLSHIDILKEIMAGIEEEGMVTRIIRVMDTSDVAFIGKKAAMLSGSGISIAIQSKGTTVIHQKDLYPLTNLELFPQAPIITLAMYRHIGKNAAKYAKGLRVKPVPVQNDYMCRPKFQVKAAIMHIKETEKIDKQAPSIELQFKG
ncbi:propanediol/glycerol family dehydratase medium subunit [Clostridium grantii]|uniref:Glycerol dehydratase medium subunit n=1 Tax=Clostridium grantii DSM 8605 TaxID=1121316 RepID=A0A1M5SX31_9CLOT|nr:propanediol/glycerol family dehydratase medium subunit [Clostridium grantii]SHH42940.1 glycerol dehydratase medium subunit [Clostridium grantii DSM 8605]